MTWDFYLVVGGSIILAILVYYLGKIQDRRASRED